MQAAIEDWVNWLWAAGRSELTVKGYAWEIRALAAAFKEKSLADLETGDLVRYLADRRRGGTSEVTLKRSVVAMRAFYHWARGDASPAKAISFPKAHKRRQRSLDDSQLLAVLATCDSSARGTRDLALLTLMVDTGLRCAEVCRLALRDVDLARRRLVVLVKGGNDSERAFSPETANCLQRWLALREQLARPGVPTVFVSTGGNTAGCPLTDAGLRVVFRYIGERAGLEGFSPHDLRRTFATLMVRSGAPTRVVQVAGGWSNLSQVEQYTRDVGLSDAARYSPVRRVLGDS